MTLRDIYEKLQESGFEVYVDREGKLVFSQVGASVVAEQPADPVSVLDTKIRATVLLALAEHGFTP